MKLFLLTIFCTFACVSLAQDSIRSKEIGDVYVSAKSIKEIAYRDSRYYIMDFHIDSNGTFLLLNRFQKYYIYLLDSKMEPKIKKLVSFHPKSLFLDCTGSLHVLSRDSMYHLEKVADSLGFTDRESIDRYEYYYKNCSASNDFGLIFKSDKNQNQSTDYYQVELLTNYIEDLYEIQDSTNLRSLRETKEEIKREEERLRRKYSRDVSYKAPTWEDQTQEGQPRRDMSTEIQNHLDRRQFYGQFVLRPYYNPLFVKDDTTFIFDHVNGEMVRLDINREVLDKRAIHYHNENHWKGEMQLDGKRDVFYSVEEKHGAQIYGRVSLQSGNIIRKIKITRHAYPEKVIVYNGYAYYVYRQFVDDNLNKLFRQKL